jgi:hypothetical protein
MNILVVHTVNRPTLCCKFLLLRIFNIMLSLKYRCFAAAPASNCILFQSVFRVVLLCSRQALPYKLEIHCPVLCFDFDDGVKVLASFLRAHMSKTKLFMLGSSLDSDTLSSSN